MSLKCYHCGLPADLALNLSVDLLGKAQSMCCQGCAAVATAIKEAGLASYYQNRTELAPQGQEIIPDALRNLAIYDHPSVQASFVSNDNSNIKQASLLLEGITCAACLWLNEQHLAKQKGMLQARVNYSKQQAFIRWDDSQIKLSQILANIRHIGYDAHPYDPSRRQQLVEQERDELLKQLGIAGIFGMQVMLLALSRYFDVFADMSTEFEALLKKVSLLLTLPVIFYSARAFFGPAWHGLKNRRMGMDVPVSVALILAFSASLLAIIRGQGEIYFDSICMFSFFLLGARYLEISIRQRFASAADLISHSQPLGAQKLNVAGQTQTIPAIELAPGDKVLVCTGEIIPGDGLILIGQTSVNESILTGESLPLIKGIGDRVIGGSINIDNPITVEITHSDANSVLSSIQNLLDKALTERPQLASLADKIASKFVIAVLLIATTVAIAWNIIAPGAWLEPTIAVLIVACPCALSLATPAALTASMGKLMQEGIMFVSSSAFDTLAQARRIVFDKTGTLTTGNLEIKFSRIFDGIDDATCLSLCSALEAASNHPVAKAFAASATPWHIATNLSNQNGAGIQGDIKGKAYTIGSPDYLLKQTGIDISAHLDSDFDGLTIAALVCENQLLCIYGLGDTVRDEAPALMRWLQQQAYKISIISGDRQLAVHKVATTLGLNEVHAQTSPAEKLSLLKRYQQHGERVIMVGDGVNDAAVLAGADVSFAMFDSAPLASASADVLLLGPNMAKIKQSIKVASKTRHVIKQNIAWSLCYNFLAIPLAAMGYIPPWLAAVGMSLSSLVVVINTLRLRSKTQ